MFGLSQKYWLPEVNELTLGQTDKHNPMKKHFLETVEKYPKLLATNCMNESLPHATQHNSAWHMAHTDSPHDQLTDYSLQWLLIGQSQRLLITFISPDQEMHILLSLRPCSSSG